MKIIFQRWLNLCWIEMNSNYWNVQNIYYKWEYARKETSIVSSINVLIRCIELIKDISDNNNTQLNENLNKLSII